MRSLVLCMLVALTVSAASSLSLPEPGVLSWPWGPQWEACDFFANPGARCVDCNTKYVCTPVGGFNKTCKATKPWCTDNGSCSETPSAECAPPESEEGGEEESAVDEPEEVETGEEHAEADEPAEDPTEA